MVKRRYTIEHLHCADCAAKIEEKLNELPGITARVVITTRTLTVQTDETENLMSRLQEVISSVEPEARLTRYTRPSDTPEEHHEHAHPHPHAQPEIHKQLLFGLALLLFGLLLDGAEAMVFGMPVSFIAYLMAYLLLGAQVLLQAAKNIRHGHVFDENFLMSIATLGAFCIGNFSEAVGVMLFYRVGEYFQELAVSRSRKQILEASQLRPDPVLLVTVPDLFYF